MNVNSINHGESPSRSVICDGFRKLKYINIIYTEYIAPCMHWYYCQVCSLIASSLVEIISLKRWDKRDGRNSVIYLELKHLHFLYSTFIPLAKNSINQAKMVEHNIKICNVNDYQLAARSILPKPLYEYLASGTDDEQTLSENVSWKRYP